MSFCIILVQDSWEYLFPSYQKAGIQLWEKPSSHLFLVGVISHVPEGPKTAGICPKSQAVSQAEIWLFLFFLEYGI
jgi:hypothetical protein